MVDAATRTARVTVPDFQLSLAIGREGQNARLAARLTGWRIDIRPDNDARPTARRRVADGRRITSGGRASARAEPVQGRLSQWYVARPPVRTCVGCRSRAPASELLRIVAIDLGA